MLQTEVPLSRYLQELSLNPNLLAEFKLDPDAALARTQLTAEQKTVMKSNDSSKIRKALSDRPFAFEEVVIDVVVVVVEDQMTGEALQSGSLRSRRALITA